MTTIPIHDLDKNRLEELQAKIQAKTEIEVTQQELLGLLVTLGETNEDELCRLLRVKRQRPPDYKNDPLWALEPIQMGNTDNTTIDRILYEDDGSKGSRVSGYLRSERVV